MATKDLTQERLKELLSYDSETGIFTRKVSLSRSTWIGQIAGTNSDGYLKISVDGLYYKGHRLAWLYIHGRWPAEQIDHIDGNRGNNAFANLREATTRQNTQNRKYASRTTMSGLLGVHYRPKSNRWVASIRIDGNPKYLGYFSSPAEAHAAYLAAKRKFHEFCTI